MIPKTIHYCWFGGKEKPKLAKKCIDSWKKYCPEYKIIEWNETNFDVNSNGYTRYCYENKKWAYLSDFVRLLVVAEHGGIYFDTDVELIKKPDELLVYDAYFGFETDSTINTGLGFGAVKNSPVIESMIQQYSQMKPDENGNYSTTNCPKLNTAALIPLGLKLDGTRQNICGAEILPIDYLNPYDNPTGRLTKTTNTFSIHWYSKSALSKGQVIRSKISRPLHRLLGVNFFTKTKRS